MINEEILRLLLERQRVLLRGVGVLHLERHWAQVSSDGCELIPPFDELVFSVEGDEWDVDLSEAVAQICGVNYDQGHRVWCDYLAMEAVDGVLTIENVAMLDIENLSVVAMDPDFAHQLNPDGELIALIEDKNANNNVTQMDTFITGEMLINERNVISNQRLQQKSSTVRVTSKPSGLGMAGYLGVILAIASVVYLVYFFTK